MPVRTSQPADFPGGQALVRVDCEPKVDPALLSIAIRRQDGVSERYLDPRQPSSPWSPQKFDFPPIEPRYEGDSLLLVLDHAVTYHMTANMTFVLQLFEGGRMVHEERTVWTGVRRLRSELPDGWVPPAAPRLPPDPPKEPPPPASPPPVEPEPEPAPLVAERLTPPPQQQTGGEGPGRSKLLGLAAAVLLLVAAGVGGALWYSGRSDQAAQPSQPAVAEPVVSLDGARQFLAANPPAESAEQMADRHLAAKSLDGAFLLYRYAANAGNPAAQLAVGAMYDPEFHSADASPLPAPNPQQAAEWYRRAAEAGDAEAQFRLAKLLLGGKTEDSDGPEKGLVWLRRAAAQGHARAAEAAARY